MTTFSDTSMLRLLEPLSRGLRVLWVAAAFCLASSSGVLAEDAEPEADTAAKKAPAAADNIKPETKPEAKPETDAEPEAEPAVDPHGKLLSEENFPSASQCAACHKKIYKEWASSNHAYASISPMFHKFEQRINDLAQGTVGYFCLRCHASVGTTLGERRDLPLWKKSKVSNEGVTCITCHRVREQYGKRFNGARRIEPGNIHDPIFGNIGGSGVAEVVENAGKWSVKPEAGKGPGMPIHREGVKFEQLSDSAFCVSCHQVDVHPGIKLEVVWDQYRASPAYRKGVTCQACHMGKEPGVDLGEDNYERGPVAVIKGKAVDENRVHHNHSFYGPGYTIAHPGLFPHNPRNAEFDIQAWLKFDYRAGWGTEDFEEKVEEEEIVVEFPEEWKDAFDRETAREIVEENLELLEEKKKLRLAVMHNGSKITGPFFKKSPRAGKALRFHFVVANINEGHNLPSGSLGAQPEIWLNVALTDPDGNNIWESGYVDSLGDMADMHSLDVAKGKIKPDLQLFNLQTKFLTTNVKGTDREMYLPINLDVDQIPFIRPAGQPITVMNHPPFVRMEGRSIPPLGNRKAHYRVSGKLLKKPGKYRLSVRLRSRAEPIYFMRFVFATIDMEQAMNEWMVDIHPYTVEFDVE